MARLKTWREKATADAITRKVQRKRSPATTYTALAREFGAPVYYPVWSTGGPAASGSFRNHIKAEVGEIRDLVRA